MYIFGNVGPRVCPGRSVYSGGPAGRAEGGAAVMTEKELIERMKRYIEKTPMPVSEKEGWRYDMTGPEINALSHMWDKAGAIILAFEFGRAKERRAAIRQSARTTTP